MKLRVEQDQNPPNPRESPDAFGKIVHWHPRRELGERCADRTACRAAIPEGSVIQPVSLFDHSCVRLWCGRLPHWSDPKGGESGQIGYIFATRQAMLKAFPDDDPENAALPQEARRHFERMIARRLRLEVERFDQFLRGDVWGYVVENKAGDYRDSRWGIFGRKNAETDGAKALTRAVQAIDLFVRS